MANLPARRCSRCPNNLPCPVHTGQRSEQATEWRKLYSTRWWKEYRVEFIAANPTCCDPFGEHGPLVPTWTADHIKPHRGNLQLFMDPTNHRPVCQRCNSKLSVREQGGFR